MSSQIEMGLHRVREDELDTLKEKLAHHLPDSFIVYGSVNMAAHFGLESLQCTHAILVPASPSTSCLTIIILGSVTSSSSQIIKVFWRPEEHTVKDVAHYLSHIPHIDWSVPVVLIGFPSILHLLDSLNSVRDQQLQIQEKLYGHLYKLEAPPIVVSELPPEYHMTTLKEKDAPVVWTNWKINFFNTEEGVRRDITHFPSVSIRKRRHEDSAVSTEEKLVSWIRTTGDGWMGNLFTLQQYRCRGLARIATLTLARQLQQNNFPIYVVIENNNTVSIKFHKKLGFKQACVFTSCLLSQQTKTII